MLLLRPNLTSGGRRSKKGFDNFENIFVTNFNSNNYLLCSIGALFVLYLIRSCIQNEKIVSGSLKN